uniref:MTSS I-BAR domain containing 1 n=1 Tax=Amphilophus citrinellus TaxID=61819 RepID=A0A3Q0SJX9_AMPCI
MDAGIEKECSALGGLFQLIMNDMKVKNGHTSPLTSRLIVFIVTTIAVTGAFLDAFQKVADMATGTRGATKEIGSALTRMCMRHRKTHTHTHTHASSLSMFACCSEYKKARADIKKKSSDTIKLQKKVKKARGQLDSALQDVNVRYAVLEETEKRAVCRALIEERARYCSFVSMLKPVLDHEINMLGEVTHLQTILEDLTNLTAEPNKLPPASEQTAAILALYAGCSHQATRSSCSPDYCTVPITRKAPVSPGSPKSTFYLYTQTHHPSPPSLFQPSFGQDQLALTLGALNSDAQRSSRDSLHCSSGYSTQTTTPSCSEDTIHTHSDSQSDFDKSSTIPRNSDLRFQYREFIQSKRPASTVSLLAESDLSGGSIRPMPSHTATIRRKPSSKPGYRRGTISGGVPIPICTPQVPLKAVGGTSGSNENVFKVPSSGGVGGLGHSKLCTSTQSLSALPPPSSSPYYQGREQHQTAATETIPATSAAHAEPPAVANNIAYQPQAPPPSSQDQNPEEGAQEGGGSSGDMLTLIRGVKLRRTITNDRSAPLLPPPTNHK